MPLFEFECLDCGRNFEKLVFKASQDQDLTCPACGSSKLEEKISTFSSASSSKAGVSSSANCAPSGS
jgi:putative FmdB family regulatory protein